jgi:hypothetical protein
MNYPDGMALLAYGDIQNQVRDEPSPRSTSDATENDSPRIAGTGTLN